MEFIHTLIQPYCMEVSAAILFVAYILIASEKISKTTIALLGACLTIILGLVGTQKYSADGAANPAYYVNYIDFNVIFLLIGMMLIVSMTAKTGIFNLLAAYLTKLSRGRPVGILFIPGIFTGFISAFLDNVTTVILVMPVTFAVCKKLEISPLPFLLAEIFASNIGGTATLIGDPPNIIIGSAANFSFMDFIKELTIVVAIILFVVTGFICLVFRRELKADSKKIAALAAAENDIPKIDKPAMIRSLSVLFLVICGFVFHGVIGIPASIVALLGATILMLFDKPQALFKELEWNTIFFFIGLFIIVGGLEASGTIKLMADFLLKLTGGSQCATAMTILWGAGFISGVIDNIPYTATMAPMISEIEKTLGAQYANPLWWSLSLGACLGGNMTIIGAAANVIVSETAAKNGVAIPFWKFFKYGFIVMLVSLLISTLYLIIRFFS